MTFPNDLYERAGRSTCDCPGWEDDAYGCSDCQELSANVLNMAAPFVAAREAQAAARAKLKAERDRLAATVARVEALAEALATAAKIETQGGEHHAARLIEAIQADLRAALAGERA